MGALTEAADSYANEQGYLQAKRLFESYGKDCPEEELQDWDTEHWYHRFTGEKVQKFFFYYPWMFRKHYESVEQIKTIVKMHSDKLAYVERPCTMNDFFLFYPPDEDIGKRYGMELQNIGCLSVEELNDLFGRIKIDSNDGWEETRLRFRW